jgi:hypothetical protein
MTASGQSRRFCHVWAASGQRAISEASATLRASSEVSFKAIRRAMARSAGLLRPYTTCYNRFVCWWRAGIWGQIMEMLAAAHDVAVQNDRHLHCASASARCLHFSEQRAVHGPVARRTDQQDSCGRRYQGCPSVWDLQRTKYMTTGSPLNFCLALGLADRGYDADWIRAFATKRRGQRPV